MTKRSYKKKKQTKNFSFVYILLILIAVAGLTVLVMSFLVPPKKKDVETTPMNTAINETEKKQEEKKKNGFLYTVALFLSIGYFWRFLWIPWKTPIS